MTQNNELKTYSRNGSKYYLAPIRMHLILSTPEESVRQKVPAWLINDQHIQPALISVKPLLSNCLKTDVKIKGKADIVIHTYDASTRILYAFASIICVAPGARLDQKILDTMEERDFDLLKVTYAMASNGTDYLIRRYDSGTNTIQKMDDPEQFIEEIKSQIIPVPETKFIRTPPGQICTQNTKSISMK